MTGADEITAHATERSAGQAPAMTKPTTHHQIVIIGGGTAGITTAARLRRELKRADIALIEPSDKHFYQPLWTLVGAGVLSKEATARNEKNYVPKGITWHCDRAATIEPDDNRVSLSSGTELTYDYLVVAPGIQLDWHKVKGLPAALGKGGVCSNYDYNLAEYTWDTISNFAGGNAIFTNPAGQVKCGGAPQKIMYLAEEHFRKHGIRERTRVIGAFAGTKMLGVAEINLTLERIVKERDIDMRFGHNLVEITPDRKEAIFQVNIEGHTELVTIPYDMIHVTPPMSAPDVVKESKLAHGGGANEGWLNVDIHTLQNPDYPNVFGLGDAAALPTAKTGAAIRKQAPVLVKNLLAQMNQEPLKAAYDGYSSCPLITGYGKLVLAEFLYDNKYKPTFPVDQTKERWDMYQLKRYVLPALYWHGMLRGRA